MHPVAIACFGTTFGIAPLVTQRSLALGKEAGGYGALFFTRKSHPTIRTIFDFPGHVIGVGGIWSAVYQIVNKVRIFDALLTLPFLTLRHPPAGPF